MDKNSTFTPRSHVNRGNMKINGEEQWLLAEALMEYHLAHKDILDDREEMNFMDMSELIGVPVCDIVAVYDTAIQKCKVLWKTTK